jgi:uncharacterized protein DUF4190
MHGTLFILFPAYFVLFYWMLQPAIRMAAVRIADPAESQNKHLSKPAVSSLIFSGLGLSVLPFLGSIIGIVLGHRARRECRGRPELRGSGIALAGLILGYLAVAMALYFAAALMVGWWAGMFEIGS